MIDTIKTERLNLTPQYNGNMPTKKYTFDIILRPENITIGYIYFQQYVLCKKIAECCYGLDKAFVGNGYMTEAVMGLKNILNQTAVNGKRIEQLEFKIDDDNIKSKNVMDRVGADFKSKGIEHNYYRLKI